MCDVCCTKNDEELYHYGVKGMKWGVRRSKSQFQEDGSSKTVKKLDKILKADKKYGQNRTIQQQVKINKLYRDYEKSISKDIKKATKQGNRKALNNMTAGRTYMKALMDSNYLNMMISDAGKNANVKTGEKFTYNVLRDNKTGTVKVNVNGVTSDYLYMPEWDGRR